MTFSSLFNDLIVLFALLLAGHAIRELVKPLQKLYIPASVIGGVLALILGPQVLNIIALPESFSSMPGVMITFVLTCSVIGVQMDKSKVSIYLTHTCIMVFIYGMQMCVGTALGCALSKIWSGLPFGWGTAAVFSFWGGHGTAASAGTAWEEYGVMGNTDIGMVMSTLGVLSCMIFGMVLINWGVRKNYAKQTPTSYKMTPYFFGGLLPQDKQSALGTEKVSNSGINNLALQMAIVLSCMLFGNKLMALVKALIPALAPLPTLINGILAGLIIWNIVKHTKLAGYVDRKTINQLSGVGLEITIVSAMATINLQVVTTYFAPILIVSAIMVVLTAFGTILLCKSWHRSNWFEKCCGSYGAATGSVPTGLALIRCVDPDSNTDAADTLAVGNSLWAPIYGSMPAFIPMFSTLYGLGVPIGIGAGLMAITLVIGMIFFRKK